MGEASLWGLALGEQCNADGEVWGWVLYPLVMLYSFYVLARLCDGHLTTALEFIVDRIQMSEDVAGATFLAMASSAPELFTSIISTFVVVSPAGAGNIVGSALFNLLVIIGVVPIFAGGDLRIWWYPTARDTVFYSVAIIELGLVLMDSKVQWWEGLIMLLSYFTYVFYFTQNSKVCKAFGLVPPHQDGDEGSERARTPEQDEPSRTENGTSAGGSEAGRGDSKTNEEPARMDRKFSPDEERTGSKIGWSSAGSESDSSRKPSKQSRSSRNSFSLRGSHKEPPLKLAQVVPMPEDGPIPQAPRHDKEQAPELTGCEEGEEPGETMRESGNAEEEEDSGWCKYEPIMMLIDATMPTSPEWLYTLFGLCVLWIAIFTYVAVDTSTRLCHCLLKIPDVVMGLVILAAGTSVPDAMGSIAVAKDGMGDMAVANAVGSNTFDILLGLGLPWFLKAAISGPVEIDTDLLTVAIIILAGCLVFYLVVLNLNRWVLTKRLGLVLLSLYVVVIVFLLVWNEAHSP